MKEDNIINKPYLEKSITIIKHCYNPNYGDSRICKCGHEYHRHFDSYDEMKNVGCKYCCCFEFEESKSKSLATEIKEKYLTININNSYPIDKGTSFSMKVGDKYYLVENVFLENFYYLLMNDIVSLPVSCCIVDENKINISDDRVDSIFLNLNNNSY